ncbi:NapC/NirT family cytochrome c [candidate division KSB1 bacterium]
MKLQLPRSIQNSLSMIGAVIALINLIIFVLLFFAQIFLIPDNPYIGIFTFLVFPMFFIIGLLLIPLGAYRQRRRKLKGEPEKKKGLPVIDLNKEEHRNALFIFIAVVVFFFTLSAIGSYQTYNFTESVSFCGKLCHEVMNPEYVTYLKSPHARVACVECHVGEGANWYVQAKLSGLYQVYATLFNKYPKPIPTPIKNLRPAQETCEHCHWPEQFYGAQQKNYAYYLSDEENTKYEINMLIKIGGGDPKSGKASGIHWHMNILHKVEYKTSDEKNMEIPWFRTINKLTGEVKTYMNEEDPVSEEFLENSKTHQMDCMDCHNRPTHILYSPSSAVNEAILLGKIDKFLPMAKSASVEILSEDYEETEAALIQISEKMWDYYKENYPEIYLTKKDKINQAITSLREIYQRNFFPEMAVKWSVYPDNIGHFDFQGCFRCHDNKHVTKDGQRLTYECKQCHLILSQELGGKKENTLNPEGLEFKHPVDIDEEWRETNCSECHTQ